MKRRIFLIGAGGVAAAAATLPLVWRTRPQASLTADLPEAAWRTLAAVHAHLFPSEANAPGAAELDTLGYLKAALEAPGFDPAERAAILHGVAALEALSGQRAGRTFAELAGAERETVLRALEADPAGRAWLEGMLNYLMEALLADPVYGGNPDGAGWHWLDHHPGFPRPPADKRWYLLKQT